MEQYLRVGLVGLEPRTHWQAYVAAAEESARVRITAAAIRPELREAHRGLLERLGARTYETAEALLESGEIDVLALSALPHEQGELVIEGLRRGLHVVADKPLVTRRDELTRVRAELAARPELRVSMLMTLRGQPVRQAVRDLVRRGAIGTPVFFQSRRAYAQQRGSRPDWFFDEELSGGPWLDGAIHGVDELVWISGKPVARVLSARDGNATWPERTRFYDHGVAVCELEGGTLAMIEHERLAMVDGLLRVVGTDGTVEVNRANQAVLTAAAGEQTLESITPYPPQRNVFGSFAESLLNGGPAIVDTKDTLAVMEAALTIREAARSSAAG